MYFKANSFWAGFLAICAVLLSQTFCLGADIPAEKDNLHVYLLIGQSNMAGRADFGEGDSGIVDRCYLFNGEDMWEPAKNPLNRYSTIRKGLGMQKMNPGYGFAQALTDEKQGVSIGLVVNAKGGTKIEQWKKGTHFYDEAVKRTKIAQKTGVLKGILWHQGEGNRNDPEYLDKLKTLIENLRADLGIPDLPFVAGQVKDIDETKIVNEQIAKLSETVPHTAFVSSKGLKTFDKWHFDTPSMKLLGKRYAEEILKIESKSHSQKKIAATNDREIFRVDGHKAFVIMPEKVTAGAPVPWVFYAPTIGRYPDRSEEWMFEKFVDNGIAIAGIDVGESMGNPEGRAVYSALYDELVGKRGFAKKAALLARSRGGLMLYNWAAENPDKVSCIAGIYPVGNLASYPGMERAAKAYGMTVDQLGKVLAEHNPIDRLAPLAEAGIPIFHLHGDSDRVVPLDKNSAIIKERYGKLGGEMTLEVVKGGGHDGWKGWFQNKRLVDFVIANSRPIKPGVSVFDLRCEYLTDPLGVDVNPRFSWKISDSENTRGQKQTAYQIIVTADAANVKIQLWDSGKVSSSESVNVEYAGLALKSNQNCHWKVRVWDKDGKAAGWSEEARFSVGLLNEADWRGEWIRYKEAEDIKHIWYRKNFSLDSLPNTAFVHLASIGYHELFVNGQRIGERVLSPGVTNLEKRVLYVTYDIADKLVKGDNVIAVWTGSGWARADGSYGKGVWEQDSIFKCQVDMSNGVSLHTDSSWKCKESSGENLGLWKGGGRGEYGGEIIDARKYIPGWNKADYDDSGWANATVYEKDIIMTAELMEPDRKVEVLWPVKIIDNDGCYTFDLGRNFTGWLEFKLRNGKAGDVVKFTTANSPGKKIEYKQESHYIHDESGEGTFSHRFNWMAGRWVSVEGLNYKPRLDDMKCYIVTNDFKRIGNFECSKQLFNDIYETDLDTYIANTVNGVTMDCPHRERYGYGEITLACTWGCGTPNYEAAAFYAKNTRDWYDVQKPDGFVNTIAPQVYKGAGGTLWSSAPVTQTWEYYKAYGDKRKLAEAYEPMKKWLDYLNEHVSKEFGVLKAYTGASRFLGDWATPHGSEYGNVPAARLFNNCVYAYNLDVFVKAAIILGKPDIAETYSKRLADLRKNVHSHFYNATVKTYIDGRQLSMAFPLYTGITPERDRPGVFANFVKEITVNKPYLDTGSSGLPILLKYIVEDAERIDLLYHCLTRTEHPGYGYFLAEGQTTWPEYWQIVGHDSMIHTCYTSIAGYFTKGIGGIRPDPENYGMKSFIVKPGLVGDLTYANTASGSYYGKIVSNWSRTGTTGKFHFEVPVNTTAKVYIPAKDINDVTESGKPAADADGVTFLKMDGGFVVLQLESGEYDFVSSSVPPAVLPVSDSKPASLPRVLVIGDSISMNYHDAAKAALKGKADYYRNEGNGGPSDRGVLNAELWLGDYTKKGAHWDVIQFNHGLHDLKQPYDKKNESWGSHQVSIENYKKNLEQVIQILKKTGAKLIWCATTPVPNSSTGKYARRKGEAAVFNKAALEVMSKHPEIQINDLHKFISESNEFDKWRKGTDVHFWDKDLQKIVGNAVANSILKALDSRAGN